MAQSIRQTNFWCRGADKSFHGILTFDPIIPGGQSHAQMCTARKLLAFAPSISVLKAQRTFLVADDRLLSACVRPLIPPLRKGVAVFTNGLVCMLIQTKSAENCLVHHLFVSTFSERSIYALEFDDATLAMTLTANISASDTHTWITLSHERKASYSSGIGSGAWYSFTAHNSFSLPPSAAIPLKGNDISPLPGPNTDNGPSGLHSVAASTPPYAVYGAGPTCGSVLRVDPATGALVSVAQDIPYTSTTSGLNATLMHGMVLSSDGRFLYVVDTRGKSIWTYSVYNTTSELGLVDAIPGRHAATHPKGGYLCVALEGANVLAQYRWTGRRDTSRGVDSVPVD